MFLTATLHHSIQPRQVDRDGMVRPELLSTYLVQVDCGVFWSCASQRILRHVRSPATVMRKLDSQFRVAAPYLSLVSTGYFRFTHSLKASAIMEMLR